MHRGHDCEDYLTTVLCAVNRVRGDASFGPIVVREMQRMRDECADRSLDLAPLTSDLGVRRMARIAAFRETDRDRHLAAAMVDRRRVAIKREARALLSGSAWAFSWLPCWFQ